MWLGRILTEGAQCGPSPSTIDPWSPDPPAGSPTPSTHFSPSSSSSAWDSKLWEPLQLEYLPEGEERGREMEKEGWDDDREGSGEDGESSVPIGGGRRECPPVNGTGGGMEG